MIGSGVLVDAFSGVLGKEDWALAVGGGRVRGTGRIVVVNSTWREGLEIRGEEQLQRERESRVSLLGTNDSGVDQRHRTPFCALKHERAWQL